MKSLTQIKKENFLALRVKGSQGWKLYDHCCLGVSLRSPNFIGDKLNLIVDFINWNFKSCIIDLSDTLNRFNLLSENHSIEQAKKICFEEGEEWLEKNYDILTNLKIPTTIIRWDHWLEHPKYKEYLNLFHKAYKDDADFKEIVHQDIERFYERQLSKKKDIDKKHFFKISSDYLLEELACHSILYEENQNFANLYPGRQHDCYKYVRNGHLKTVPQGLLTSHHTRLLFYTRRAMNDNIVETEK